MDWKLELVAIPRRPANPTRNQTNGPTSPSNRPERMTDWMVGRISIAVWIKPAGAELKTIENRVMNAWLPPLNLTGARTRWTSDVKAARTAMAAAAKRCATSRGLIN